MIIKYMSVLGVEARKRPKGLFWGGGKSSPSKSGEFIVRSIHIRQ